MSRLLWFLMVSTLFVMPSFASEVDVTVEFNENKALFSYFFVFDEGDSYNSFSFEKPRDALLLFAKNTQGEFIRTSVAGDYFIVYPEITSNQTFEIAFESPLTYELIEEENSFSTYFSFNYEVDLLTIETDFSEIQRDISTITPRDYSVIGENKYSFEFRDVERETFLQVIFDSDEIVVEDEDSTYLYVILSFLILLLVFLAFFMRTYLKGLLPKKRTSSDVVLSNEGEVQSQEIDVLVSTNRDEPSSNADVVVSDESVGSVDDVEEDVEPTKEEQFYAFLDKFLTENEREVVLVVKEKPGIAQNEILHHLPSLTKSNLSKIITKLHGKQILSRIRVGKINKIHLGEKLLFENNASEDNT